jgi:transposase
MRQNSWRFGNDSSRLSRAPQTKIPCSGDKDLHRAFAWNFARLVFPKLPVRYFRLSEGHVSRQLSLAEREQLQQWTRSRTSSHRVVARSRIVLLSSRGLSTSEVAKQLRVSPATVRLWCRRFEQGGPAALAVEAGGRGRPRGASPDVELAVLRATRSSPEDAWSVRGVAARARTSPTNVWRIWKRHGLGSWTPRHAIDARIEQLISGTDKRQR